MLPFLGVFSHISTCVTCAQLFYSFSGGATSTQGADSNFNFFSLEDFGQETHNDSSSDEYNPEERFCRFDSPSKVAEKSNAALSKLVTYSDSESEQNDVVEVGSSPAKEASETKSKYTFVNRFKEPVSSEELEKLSEKTFAASTERKIQWAVKLFQNWHFSRIRVPECDGRLRWCDIEDGRIQPSNLAHCLCMFLSEVRHVDGTEYPARTLYSIVVMLQMHFDKMGKLWKLIDGDEFVKVKHTLDNLMKQRAKTQTGVSSAADPISVEAEEKMWRMGVLGESNPNQLRNTVMFLIGLSFALRGGEEQRNLRSPGYNPQIVVKVYVSGKKFLEYTEDTKMKTNQGGLKHKWLKPKVVRTYGNPDPDRNLVRLYEKYCSLLPPREFSRCSALYKYQICENRVTPRQWFTDKPLGVNKV